VIFDYNGIVDMTTGKITTGIIILLLVLVAFLGILKKELVIYTVDTCRGYVLGLISDMENRDRFTIVYPSLEKEYVRPYAGKTERIYHSGQMLFYRTDSRESLRAISKRLLGYTHYYRSYNLEKAIMEANALNSKTVDPNVILFIPYSLSAAILDMKKTSMPDIPPVRGLYFTGNSLGNYNFIKSLKELRKQGINTIVFDAKDIPGIISYLSHVPAVQELNTHGKRTVDDIASLIRIFKSLDYYVIARLAVFHDHLLVKKKPEYGIQSRTTGRVWNEGSKELWCDPTNKYVQDYNIAIALELAHYGVDEIQFDYIRFPTTGNLHDANYAWHFGKMQKEEVIAHFLKRASSEIHATNTRVSIDIFGVVAWGKSVDIRKTGQKVELLARYCDVISPMLYPSHFNDDFDGFSKPGDNPYYFIYQGCKRVKKLAGGTRVRPWLQAFKWRVSNYNEEYILQQVKASHDAGAEGYLFWNAGNNYGTVIKAMASLKIQDNDKNTANITRRHSFSQR